MTHRPIGWIAADWPAPPGIRAGTTTREGGVSAPPFDRLNLAGHVGDDPAAVAQNRVILRQALALPSEPLWLEQNHGTTVIPASCLPPDCRADGSTTDQVGVICAVLAADCLPVLLCNENGTRVAAAHAGWRGLLNGILEQAALPFAGESAMAWLGPAIGPRAFEVGPQVREQFCDVDAGAAAAFRPTPAGRWLADLYCLARQRLSQCGIERTYGGHFCTWSDQRFFSYRRHSVTGRMASLIWIQSGA